MALKIRVGGRYKMGSGRVVEIVAWMPKSPLKTDYLGVMDERESLTFTERGFFFADESDSLCNLVEELDAPAVVRA
jgi:hypothetical protein